MAEIPETPVTGLPGRTPREDIEAPVVGTRKREPVLVWDISGSNNELVEPGSTMTKAELALIAVPLIVGALAGDDSEAAAEQADGSSDKGGVRAFTFNEPGRIVFERGEDESDDYRDLGDLNEANVKEKLSRIRFEGRTYAKPAIDACEYAYLAEFPTAADRANRALEIVVITDGKLSDPDEFEAWLDTTGPDKVMAVAVIGSGAGHDEAVAHYKKHASPFLKVLALTGVSDPTEVAFDVRLLAGTAAS